MLQENHKQLRPERYPLASALSMYYYSLVEPIKREEWRPDNRIPIGNNRAMKQNCHSANLLSSLCVHIYKMEASHVILHFSKVDAVFGGPILLILTTVQYTVCYTLKGIVRNEKRGGQQDGRQLLLLLSMGHWRSRLV